MMPACYQFSLMVGEHSGNAGLLGWGRSALSREEVFPSLDVIASTDGGFMEASW